MGGGAGGSCPVWEEEDPRGCDVGTCLRERLRRWMLSLSRLSEKKDSLPVIWAWGFHNWSLNHNLHISRVFSPWDSV